MHNHPLTIVVVITSIILTACSRDPGRGGCATASDYQKELQTLLITAKPGDVITISEGVHEINRGLSLNVSGVTLRGHGMDKSILSVRPHFLKRSS